MAMRAVTCDDGRSEGDGRFYLSSTSLLQYALVGSRVEGALRLTAGSCVLRDGGPVSAVPGKGVPDREGRRRSHPGPGLVVLSRMSSQRFQSVVGAVPVT